jgi:hypothetical protein
MEQQNAVVGKPELLDWLNAVSGLSLQQFTEVLLPGLPCRVLTP